MKTCRLYVDVDYDPLKTDPEAVAAGLDTLMETALSTPDILDDYGNPKVGSFYVQGDGDTVQQRLLNDIELLEELVEAKKSDETSPTKWQQVYDTVFETYKDKLCPAVAEVGLPAIDWQDPDMGYDDDVLAFMKGLAKTKQQLLERHPDLKPKRK